MPRYTETVNLISTTGKPFSITGSSPTSAAEALAERNAKMNLQNGLVISASSTVSADDLAPLQDLMHGLNGDNGRAAFKVISTATGKKRTLFLGQVSIDFKRVAYADYRLLDIAAVHNVALTYVDADGVNDYTPVEAYFVNKS